VSTKPGQAYMPAAYRNRRYAAPRAPKPVTGAERFEQVEALLLAHFADDQPGRRVKRLPE